MLACLLACGRGADIHVAPAEADRLRQIVRDAVSGTTILLADGTYALDGGDAKHRLDFATPGVTLRSASGQRDRVILDGGHVTTELVSIAASNVTIADLTLRRVHNHLIHVVPGAASHTTGTLIQNCRLVDPGQQAIKINANPERPYFADEGVIAGCSLELTREGRARIRDNCYTGGVDAHRARGWIVRENTIAGFWCQTGLSEHGVHFWTGSRDTVVERNTIVNCARGIGFGLGSGTPGRAYADAGERCAGVERPGHVGGVIRNNVVVADDPELFSSQSGFDAGISLDEACGAHVLHNTVASTRAPFASLEYRWKGTRATILNNLLTHRLVARDGATATLGGNVENAPPSLFVELARRNVHLAASAAAAIDRGVAVPAGLCDADLDGDARGAQRDVGADEVK
jgi:hypothetical protein